MTPAFYSKPFVEALASAFDAGHISMRYAAGQLDMTLDDLADLFVAHGVELPDEL